MSHSRHDQLLIWILRVVALVAAAVVLFVVLFVLLEAVPALKHVGVLRFLQDDSWHPTEGQFGIRPMLLGTVFVTAGAAILAIPLGVLSAIFCNHYAPAPLARLYRRMTELLVGIPSVVYGLWGLVVLVPLIGRLQPPGASLLAGIFILTLMILPTVTLIADASIAALPPVLWQSAAALGLSRWAILRHVVLPAARSGILTGSFLATARAAGETMAVLMVCGNVVQVPHGLLDPMRALTANIALEMAYAMGDHRSALFVTALALILMVAVLVMAAELLDRRRHLL